MLEIIFNSGMLASLTFNFLIFIEAIDSCPAILRGKIKLKSFKSYEALKYDYFLIIYFYLL